MGETSIELVSRFVCTRGHIRGVSDADLAGAPLPAEIEGPKRSVVFGSS
jgi:hypothetical protein